MSEPEGGNSPRSFLGGKRVYDRLNKKLSELYREAYQTHTSLLEVLEVRELRDDDEQRVLNARGLGAYRHVPWYVDDVTIWTPDKKSVQLRGGRAILVQAPTVS